MTDFGLNDHTLKGLRSVFESYPEIEEVVVYGSRAKGNYREGSDIDLCMKGASLNRDICGRVWMDIDALNTPYLIDLSVHHLLQSESLSEHIRRVGKTLYRKGEVDVQPIGR
ncbi:MAG: nucleotidyltransferase domain-containing protein [Cryomorphaceae bacterium]|nr:nucleotidyltransferase domain-containing protein [Flavobacteriales bacterium]